jgi:hypothetical protein
MQAVLQAIAWGKAAESARTHGNADIGHEAPFAGYGLSEDLVVPNLKFQPYQRVNIGQHSCEACGYGARTSCIVPPRCTWAKERIIMPVASQPLNTNVRLRA